MLTAEGFYKQPEDATPEVTLRRPADTFSTFHGVKDQQLADRIYHAVINKWFMYSSPVLSNSLPALPSLPPAEEECEGGGLEGNVGTQGLPISCFLSMIPDSKEGLVAARSEAAWLSMMGGGISVYAANRSVDSKSTGVMAHLKGYDSDTLSYRQTATRRGSMAAYLDIDHPEIVSFLEMRDPTGGDSNKKCFNLNNATNLTDSYMHAVIKGTSYPLIDPKHGATGKTLDAREIWELQMNLRFNTGEPYTTFIDNINNRLPIQITNPDYRVRQSNLCVAPETLILTDKGYLPIASLEGEQVKVWNSKEWSEVTIIKTGTNQPLITVITSGGQELTCTPYHKFYVLHPLTTPSPEGGGDVGVEKRAIELKVGDSLLPFYLPATTTKVEPGQVVSILDTGRKDDTFCFTEPKRGMGVFNGILTGQCNEITLMTSEERTAVCCLSSLNLDKYDEWKDTNLVADLVTFLDNVLEFFIENAHPVNLKRAIFSASQERAIGIGTIGFHSYLQSKSIAFESRDAAREAYYIYKDIKDKALAQSIALGAERGVAPDCADRTIACNRTNTSVSNNREGSTYLGTRNSHLLAVAPNASSADLLGELITLKDGTVYDSSPSPSIEPLAANAYNSQGRAGSHLLVNRHLVALLNTKYNKATPEVIENIIQHKGSVQQLDFLSQHEKNVFKTFTELNPMWVVELAAVRQEHICQSQSVNIRVSNSITLEQMSDIHMSAWQKGLKGLYYCRSEAAGKTNVGTGGDKPLNSVPVTIEYGSCLACEG